MLQVLSFPAVTAMLAGALTSYFWTRVWPYRDRPGGHFFAATVAFMALWSVSYGLALTVHDPALRQVFEVPIWVGINGTALTFVAFALAYTGRGHVVRSPVMAVIAAVPVASTLLVATYPLHDLVLRGYDVEALFGAATVTYAHGPWLFATTAVAYGLLAAAVFLLLDTVVSYGDPYRRQAVALAVSPVPAVVVSLPWLFQLGPYWQLNLIPLTFPIHVALDTYALFQEDMFAVTPAARRAGERAAIDDLGSGVVLVDVEGRIITANAEAERVLDLDADATATDLDVLLDDDLALDGTDQHVTRTVDGTERRYAITTSPIDAADGTHVGYTLVFQDVTLERRREQRLEVLNRVIRHNLRNDMTVVRGTAELIEATTDEPETADRAADIVAETQGLVDLGEKAHRFERTVSDDTVRRDVALRDLLAGVLADVRQDHPDVDLALAVPDGVTVRTNPDLLELAFHNLVENAVVHGRPADGGAVGDGGTPGKDHDDAATDDDASPTSEGTRPASIAVPLADDAPSGETVVEVVDDGPGIPDHEVAVLDQDRETALEHGSGIGLWLVKWCVAAAGADVSFTSSEDGTTAAVRFRAPDGDGAASGECVPEADD
jgi:signal transduction histidine kinase